MLYLFQSREIGIIRRFEWKYKKNYPIETGKIMREKYESGLIRNEHEFKEIQWYLDNREWWETIISGEYQNYYEKMYGNR